MYEFERLSEEEIMAAVPIMQAMKDNYELWETEELTEKQKLEMR